MKRHVQRHMILFVLLIGSCHKIKTNPHGLSPAQLGTHYYNTCNYDAALQCFIQSKNNEPHNIIHHLNIAKTYLQKENFDKALQTLQILNESQIEQELDLHLDYLWISGNIYRHMHSFKKAHGFFNQIIALANNDNHRHLWLAGNAYSALNEPLKAITLWQQALDLLPENEPKQSEVTLHRNIGHTSIIAKNYALAIEHLHRAIELNPHMASTFDSLGTAYRKNNQINLAIKWYNKALQIDPKWANSLSNLGICLRKEGDITQAIEQFYAAIELRSNHYGAHFQLGKTYLYQKNKELALEYLHKAYVINDQNGIVAQKTINTYIERAHKLLD